MELNTIINFIFKALLYTMPLIQIGEDDTQQIDAYLQDTTRDINIASNLVVSGNLTVNGTNNISQSFASGINVGSVNDTGHPVYFQNNSGVTPTLTTYAGDLIMNTPNTGKTIWFNVNGNNVFQCQNPGASSGGLVMGNSRILMSKGNGFGVEFNLNTSNKYFQIVNASGTDDMFLANGSSGGSLIFQTNGTNAFKVNSAGRLIIYKGVANPVQFLTGYSVGTNSVNLTSNIIIVDTNNGIVSVNLSGSGVEEDGRMLTFKLVKATNIFTIDCVTNGTYIDNVQTNMSIAGLNTVVKLVFSNGSSNARGWHSI